MYVCDANVWTTSPANATVAPKSPPYGLRLVLWLWPWPCGPAMMPRSPAPSWAGPWSPCGPSGPLWAGPLWALVGPLGPYGPGLCGPPGPLWAPVLESACCPSNLGPRRLASFYNYICVYIYIYV